MPDPSSRLTPNAGVDRSLRLIVDRPAHGVEDPLLDAVLNDLDRLTNWENRPRGAMRVNLDCIRDLSERLDYPELHFRSIHVTGTKGKSSTAALLEASLRKAGFKVGRYSSPHVDHIGERMTLDGEPVGERAMAEVLSRALDVFRTARRAGTAGQDATWFDLMTIAAFDLFRERGVEWAIVEAGLGGRLDSTNIVDSDIAIITNVELEHTDVLGDTRTKIAFEKAGIIKPGSVAVTPLTEMDDAGAVIAVKARAMGATLAVPTIPRDATLEERNALIAGAALDTLGERGVWEKSGSPYPRSLGNWLIDDAVLKAARLPGRMERLAVAVDAAGDVPVVIDGAHVPFNLRAVLNDLKRESDFSGPFTAVFSVARDKDAEGLLRVLQAEDVELVLTRATTRSRDPGELAAIAARLGLKHVVEPDPLVAYKGALHDAVENGRWVLVTGSLYLTGVVHG
ncbi:bifunctional folylpolyglutamate synthase/dihydrofolate synthase [Allorhizobium borbori]|uniref:Dihydrofolate synthase/folylpolyglutamate synthase n=1 Tax=Allorhizobium borbori TaxID=485907 RepID=A0A7W6K5R5_9HYPH|nr:dihydrofolate synthase/folylpolyglutamate synthase [Allorhizobium borbori]